MDNKAALTEAIRLTDEILAVLEDGEFDRVNELENKRKPLISMAFADPVEEIDLIKAQHLKNLNQQVVDKLILLKQSVLLQQEQNRIAAKATQAYQDNDSVPK